MLHTLAIILCNELPSVISEPWLHLGSGGSRGVPWVPQNSPFYHFARMRRRPRGSQNILGQQNPPFKILDLPLLGVGTAKGGGQYT